MKYCNDCGTELSDTAKTCPKCGADIRKQLAQNPSVKRLLTQKRVADVFFFLIIAICLFSSGGIALMSIDPLNADKQWVLASISGAFFAAGLICGAPFLIWELMCAKKLKKFGYV